MTDSTSGADYDFDYDLLGRVTSITQSIGGLTPTVVMTAQYDAAGRRTQLAASIGGTGDFLTEYAYDHLGRVDWIRQQDQGAQRSRREIRRLRLRSDGPACFGRSPRRHWADCPVAATGFTFDNAGRLTKLAHDDDVPVESPIAFAEYNLAYDLAGRITGFDFCVRRRSATIRTTATGIHRTTTPTS